MAVSNKLLVFTTLFVALFFGETLVSAQSNPFPNEVKGFEFFGKGRLKSLRLGSSTEADVKKIFGDCGDECDYNEYWKIRFVYIDNEDCFTTTTDDMETTLCAAKEFIGKLSSVHVSPKQAVSFLGVSSSKFTRFGGGGSYSSSCGGGVGSSMSYSSFGDESGLGYAIFSSSNTKSEPELVKGDLLNVNYVLTEALKKKIYTVEK